MHFISGSLLLMQLLLTTVHAKQSPADVAPSDIFRTVAEDINIFTEAVKHADESITGWCGSRRRRQGPSDEERNEKINDELDNVVAAAYEAGDGVAGDIADVSTDITGPEAALVKEDIKTLMKTSKMLAELYMRIGDQSFSDSNEDLDSYGPQFRDAVMSILAPIQQYTHEAVAVNGSNRDAAVRKMQWTADGASMQLSTMFTS